MLLKNYTTTATANIIAPARSLREQMILIRVLEDKLQELCLQGLGADLHFSKGQEAICVGVCAALRETDYVVTHHRSIAHAVAKGVPLYPLVAEILGKATGMNGGLAGEMHMTCPEKRFMFSWQLVGTCVPVAAGLAWAVKHHLKTDGVVVVFHGDAATANGQWHEGINVAAVQSLPLLLVCENNELAGNVKPAYYLPTRWVRDRAKGYGIRTFFCDASYVYDVKRFTKMALEETRRTSRPVLLEAWTARLGRHKQGQGDLRTKEEIAALALRDPLKDLTLEERAPYEAEVENVIRTVMAGPNPSLNGEENETVLL